MAQGNYVTDKRIGKVDSEIWDEETVQFIAKGNDVKAKYQGSTTNFDNTKGWPRLVATDQRVFIKVPKLLNTKVESIGYDDLSAADLGGSGITGTEIKLRTIQGKTYTFRADEPDDTEIEEMVEFIRSRITGEQQTEPSPSSTASSTSPDRAELHKTESCVECGESVSDGVNRCPHCSYDPEAHRKWWWIHTLLIGLLWATIIGIPFSIIPFLKSRKHSKKYKQGVSG